MNRYISRQLKNCFRSHRDFRGVVVDKDDANRTVLSLALNKYLEDSRGQMLSVTWTQTSRDLP